MCVFWWNTVGVSEKNTCVLLLLIASASLLFVFVCRRDGWFKYNRGFMESFAIVQLICTSALTLQHINQTCSRHYKQLLISFNEDFSMHYKCSLMQSCNMFALVLHHPVINYEFEWLPLACQHGLLLRLGMGHSGHEGQSYHGFPAGSGSSGPLIDPGPAEQTAALDVTLFSHQALARTETDSLMGHQNKLPV